MNGPKPTPRDSIYRLLAATADSPAVETLQADCSEIIVALDELDTLRAENAALKAACEQWSAKLQEISRPLGLDIDAPPWPTFHIEDIALVVERLRAEVAVLKAKLEKLIERRSMVSVENERLAAERTALAARVEALRQLAAGQGPQHLYQGDCPYADDFEARDPDCPACQILSSAADLQAHDDRIRRETVERIVEEVMDVDCVRDLDGFEQLNIQEAIHRAAGIPAPSTGEEE